jgi:uncharacterized OB-fold protein
MSESYLPKGMPIPVPQGDGLDKTYWEATRRGELMIQKCGDCSTWQWGPEWVCHNCCSFNMTWEQIEPSGRVYSWERPWHPVHPALKEQGPYLVVLIELPQAGNVRMIGNLLGDSHQKVVIGSKVEAVFEPHDDTEPPYTLVQWRVVAE